MTMRILCLSKEKGLVVPNPFAQDNVPNNPKIEVVQIGDLKGGSFCTFYG
jgi:hypothetical protein